MVEDQPVDEVQHVRAQFAEMLFVAGRVFQRREQEGGEAAFALEEQRHGTRDFVVERVLAAVLNRECNVPGGRSGEAQRGDIVGGAGQGAKIPQQLRGVEGRHRWETVSDVVQADENGKWGLEARA